MTTPTPAQAPPDPKIAAKPKVTLARLVLAIVFILFSFVFIRVPHRAVTDEHDPGSHMLLEYCVAHHIQFGSEFIQNAGPWGYLNYLEDYSGILPYQQFAFGIVFGVLMALLATYALQGFTSRIVQILWVVVLVSLTPNVKDNVDHLFYLFLLLVAHYLLSRDKPWGWRWLIPVLLVVMALFNLMKSTHLALSGLMVALLLARELSQKRYASVALHAGIYAIAFVALWLLAGQRLPNLPLFLVGTFAFSQGYNEALSFYNIRESSYRLLAILAFAVFVLVNLNRHRHIRRYASRLPLTLWEAAFLFILWKHSYVRADWYHVQVMWMVLTPAVLLIYLAWENPPAGVWARMLAGLRVPAVIVTLILCVRSFYMLQLYPSFETMRDRVQVNASAIFDWPGARTQLDKQLSINRAAAALLLIRAQVGQSTVDQYGYSPGSALLNDLNYHFRPMPINFAACNAAIMIRNAQFYADPATAPQFVMVAIGDPTFHFHPQNDSLTLLELLAHYQYVLEEKGQLLLKRRPDPSPPFTRTLLGTSTITWGQSLDVPDPHGAMLWCSVEMRFSTRGAIESFLYKPAWPFIELEQRGLRTDLAHFLVSAASTGFLINPLIVDNGSFRAVLDPANTKIPRPTQPDEMQFVVDPAYRDCFTDDIRVSFWRIERAPEQGANLQRP